MIKREESLEYHAGKRPGKIELKPTKPCLTPRDLRLAYLPGASFPSQAIANDPAAIYRYTARGNLVGVITNGSAVPGLGDVGPGAAKPMQEGIAILFKRLADIDVFDLELETNDPDSFVSAVRMITPTFGGINLKDLKAPDGLYIYDRLLETSSIPVFHENLYSTAVVAMAALQNALDLVEKKIDSVRLVICGAGTVGIGCARLLRKLGVPGESLLLYDVRGLIHPGRDDLNEYQRVFARESPFRSLASGLEGADVFIGASAGGVLTQEMIRSMGRFPIVFALATPEPEIDYAAARASRRDVIVATSLGEYPNAVADLLSFPYIFRGALDARAKRITEGMMLAAARALADLAREEVVEEVVRAYGGERFQFGPEYLLPKPIDPRVLVRESAAVAHQAAVEGVAQRPLEIEPYQESLGVRMGTGREMMRQLIIKARQVKTRVVFPEGTNETALRACHILKDEGIAIPILLGREEEVRAEIMRLGVDLASVTIIDPARAANAEAYAEEYFHLRMRRGTTLPSARAKISRTELYAAMMLHSGDADMMVAGVAAHYVDSLRSVLEVIGPAPGIRRISGHYMALLPKQVYFLADCAVNVDPDAEELAEIAMLAARMVRSLGIAPQVAMLSFSNFGSVDHPFARKVRRAAEIARGRMSGLVIDGEMQLATAVDSALRGQYFPFSEIKKDANVLIFPDLQSGNLALHLLQYMGEAVLVGPVLMGARRPVHLLQYGASVEDVVNLTAMGVVQAAADRQG
jgi:malate dehydrogenase (oxaloacetate-decarboxylating)(NADP+)